MKYVANVGSTFTNNEAQVYGEFIQSLIDKNGGITPEMLVDNSIGNPIEAEFEWNNDLAAERYRRTQALYILRHINVVLVNSSGMEYQIRAFHYLDVEVQHQEGDDKFVSIRIYKDTQSIVDLDRDQLLIQILNKFIELQKKYHPYRELDPIFEAIDMVSNQLGA